MRRTQIYLTEEESVALKRESKKSRASMSDLIRSAIDERYLRQGGLTTEEKIAIVRRSAGAWKGRTETGEAFVERMRSGRLARLHGWDK